MKEKIKIKIKNLSELALHLRERKFIQDDNSWVWRILNLEYKIKLNNV